jgi:hypothetical protein
VYPARTRVLSGYSALPYGYSPGTLRVLSGYSPGTLRVLSGYSALPYGYHRAGRTDGSNAAPFHPRALALAFGVAACVGECLGGLLRVRAFACVSACVCMRARLRLRVRLVCGQGREGGSKCAVLLCACVRKGASQLRGW